MHCQETEPSTFFPITPRLNHIPPRSSRIVGLSSGGETQLDLQELDQSVEFYFQNALAPPNKKRLTSQQRPIICNFVQKGASVLCPSQNINCANMLPT